MTSHDAAAAARIFCTSAITSRDVDNFVGVFWGGAAMQMLEFRIAHTTIVDFFWRSLPKR